MMWIDQELRTKMWRKTGSDISRKVTPASKTDQSQEDLLLWMLRRCLKWLNNSQVQALTTEHGSSHNTINRELHKIGLVDRRFRKVPHECKLKLNRRYNSVSFQSNLRQRKYLQLILHPSTTFLNSLLWVKGRGDNGKRRVRLKLIRKVTLYP